MRGFKGRTYSGDHAGEDSAVGGESGELHAGRLSRRNEWQVFKGCCLKFLVNVEDDQDDLPGGLRGLYTSRSSLHVGPNPRPFRFSQLELLFLCHNSFRAIDDFGLQSRGKQSLAVKGQNKDMSFKRSSRPSHIRLIVDHPPCMHVPVDLQPAEHRKTNAGDNSAWSVKETVAECRRS